MPENFGPIIGGVFTFLAAIVGLAGGIAFYYLRRLYRKIDVLEKQNKKHERVADKNREHLENAKELVQEKQDRIRNLRERLKSLEGKYNEAIEEKEKRSKSIDELESDRRRWKAQAEGVDREKRAFEQRNKELEVEFDAMRRNCQEMSDRVGDLNKQLEKAREDGGMNPQVAQSIKLKDEELGKLRQERLGLDARLRNAEVTLGAHRSITMQQEAKIETLNDQLDKFVQENQTIRTTLDQKTRALDESAKEMEGLRKQMDDLKGEYDKLLKEKVTEPEGRIWERPAGKGTPVFIQLQTRAVPIISVINLKGGVGKTTITANLAATWGLHGKRVLMIDLDFQRSLTELCMGGLDGRKDKELLYHQKRTLQHFLNSPNADVAYLLKCAADVKKAGLCKLVINTEEENPSVASDSLEDTEMYLQARWLMDPSGTDVRFLLRKALHSPALRGHFDYVLLDCPPRLSTACINALTASDFALIPVELDNLSAISAQNVLRKLKSLREKGILANLRILGILANKVQYFGGKLVKTQEIEWKRVEGPCKIAWGDPVELMKTMLKRDSAFGKAQNVPTFAAFTPELKPVFSDLMNEIEARILYESGRIPTVSSIPG